MTDREKKIRHAIAESKRYFGECLLTGARETDGAHIVPRDYKTAHGYGIKLAACKYNIVPLHRLAHESMDKLTEPEERIFFLIDLVSPEQRYRLNVWLECLVAESKKVGLVLPLQRRASRDSQP